MAAEHPEPDPADADHGGGEPALVQSGGAGQQHVLGVLHMGAQGGQDHRARGRAPTGDVHQTGRAGQPLGGLAPAEEPRRLLDQHEIGGTGPDDPGQRRPVVAHRADVVAEHADHGRTVGLGTGVGKRDQGGGSSHRDRHAGQDRAPSAASPEGRDGRCPAKERAWQGARPLSPGGPGRPHRPDRPCRRAGRRAPGRAAATGCRPASGGRTCGSGPGPVRPRPRRRRRR